MAKKTVHHADSIQNQIPRRTMLSLPVAAGAILMLNEPASAGIVVTVQFIQQNTSTGDSLALYTNLLPEVRRYELARSLQGLDRDKAVVSGALRKLVELGQALNSKYRGSSVPNNAEVLTDLRQVTGRMTEIEGIADILDATREKLPFIRQFDSSVDSIHSLLLSASADFAKAKEEDITTRDLRTLRSDGTAKLDNAILMLKKMLRKELNETALETPLERLIVLLLGVRVAVEREAQTRHHASFAGIMDVLRAHITPGSLIQLGIGYSVAFPVLIRNTDQSIREKLLMDGLRLVPGLVPSPLVDTAKQLSVLTL
jgi:hypothetical protein